MAPRLVPGDLGTKGGIRTDVSGRAHRDDDSIIDGLYAAGNVGADDGYYPSRATR